MEGSKHHYTEVRSFHQEFRVEEHAGEGPTNHIEWSNDILTLSFPFVDLCFGEYAFNEILAFFR